MYVPSPRPGNSPLGSGSGYPALASNGGSAGARFVPSNFQYNGRVAVALLPSLAVMAGYGGNAVAAALAVRACWRAGLLRGDSLPWLAANQDACPTPASMSYVITCDGLCCCGKGRPPNCTGSACLSCCPAAPVNCHTTERARSSHLLHCAAGSDGHLHPGCSAIQGGSLHVGLVSHNPPTSGLDMDHRRALYTVECASSLQ